MTLLIRVIHIVLLALVCNTPLVWYEYKVQLGIRILWIIVFLLYFVGVNMVPSRRKESLTGRIRQLGFGIELLLLFLITICFNLSVVLRLLFVDTHVDYPKGLIVAEIVVIVLLELILFWNGILRIYLTSVQLGLKWRIVGILVGWIPVVHLVVLFVMLHITIKEYHVESEKEWKNQLREGEGYCVTKYPIVLIHGVFFRDTKYMNYWGRIPGELMRNGAIIYYGEQQSAASVEASGKEIAHRVREIVEKSGCGKVNLIAHSKGGLDARYAISHLGIAPLVASLTTINTPHQGCIFAEYLIHKAPQGLKEQLSRTYNQTLRKLGDSNPDFMAAVTDLTDASCRVLNEGTLDQPEVFYQSVGSCMHRAASGKFPLNLSYPLVKHFDGANDGLVSVESARWGTVFHPINISTSPEDATRGKCRRGISHADVIDLNRQNIPGFDVREYYVKLVHELKNRGF